MSLPLPVASGTYILLLDLPQATPLQVGRLGDFHFPSGVYAYVGSAFGPGGLRARLGRHLHPGRPHWHVDYLRLVAQVCGIAYALTPRPQECLWSQALASLPGAWLPAPGFGASDCRKGCRAHLIGLGKSGCPIQEKVKREIVGVTGALNWIENQP